MPKKKTTTKKTSTGTNPQDLVVASALADEKYGPQIAAVKDLYGQAKEQYKSDIDAATASAAAAQLNAKRATPGMRAIYGESGRSLATTGGEVDTSLAGIGPAADIFKASIARERGTAANRVSSARAGALSDLLTRGVQAEGGKQLALGQARKTYGKTADTLSTKLTDIAGQRGSSIAAALGDLRTKRAERVTRKTIAREGIQSREDIAAANRTAANQRAAAKAKQGGKKAAGGSGGSRATNVQIGGLSDNFQKALRYAKGYATNQRPRSQAADDLLRGRDIPKGGDPSQRVPSFGQLTTSVALDMAYDGHVSQQNAKRLHKLGFDVADISGALSYEDWLKGRQGRANSKYGWGQ